MLRICAAAIVVLFATGCRTEEEQAAIAMTGGDPHRGVEAIHRYGCGSCHSIPGIRSANAFVGPPLDGVASRLYLAGHLRNTPENLMQWIQHPQKIEPNVIMPAMGVTERDARDIAAYLYTLD